MKSLEVGENLGCVVLGAVVGLIVLALLALPGESSVTKTNLNGVECVTVVEDGVSKLYCQPGACFGMEPSSGSVIPASPQAIKVITED